ncbi:MAG: hypothetical protein K2Y51_26025 [Gammaproteobacteria bacterium]|nr:hypothetical protein [Gammaproteobacteria bacterium]
MGSPVFLPFLLTMTAAWATNDQLKLCKLPKQYIAWDLVIDWPDMDSGANLVYDVGLYQDDTATDATVGTVVDTDCFIAASTTARAVGRERLGNALQAALAAAYAPSDTDLIVVATATTGGAGTASKAIRGYLMALPAGYDD